jgi:hypothetical protein
MTFRLRTVSLTADGRAIIRDRANTAKPINNGRTA